MSTNVKSTISVGKGIKAELREGEKLVSPSEEGGTVTPSTLIRKRW